MTNEEMVEKFLCVGCVCGSDTSCGSYRAPDGWPSGCAGHVLGIIATGIGHFALGLPKGFNRSGWCFHDQRTHNQMSVRMIPAGSAGPAYNDFNVPVWCLDEDGFLFVRVALPRLSGWILDVYEGGKKSEICPDAIDMTGRTDEYD